VRELALHLLDIAENSVAARAKNITISVLENTKTDLLFLQVIDDGCGMDAAMAAMVIDPFVTSRTTRKVGLGIPLLKAAAEACNGFLKIESEPGKGTTVTISFQRSHIDRMPLGDLSGTFFSLLIAVPEVHWVFKHQVDEEVFLFDDQPVKAELDGIPLTEPGVITYLRGTLQEGLTSLTSLPYYEPIQRDFGM
jgi:anti-sigma regulatory factor (Ser/Thr protein kinase)